jgi:Uma2 family endonuclease
MQAVLQPLTRSPRLKLLLEELQHFSEDEDARRRRFYEHIADGVKTEFINGEVIVHSPDRAKHIEIRERLAALLRIHVSSRGLGWVGGEKALTVFTRNDYMPDIVFFGKAKAAKIDSDTMKFPVPDFVVEVLSPSTKKRDRGTKLDDYAGHGVGEYWIIDPLKECVEVYLQNGEGGYRQSGVHARGQLRSTIIKDFAIPVRAIFNDADNLKAMSALLGR